ncbi:MAG: WbqC family protein, partial [Bacteroidaceae bacterium]|nr:WbqC family protein [Bacteroidaceae bacterium]
QPYYQVFADKTGFLANLSIVDLLFNMGPEAPLIIKSIVSI